jgi:hypothetical protein
MEFKDNGEFIECYDYCYQVGDDRLMGAIRKSEDESDYYIFHPARKITLTSIQLQKLSLKLSELKKLGESVG